ncbi:MAG: hypothetical protein QXY45_01090 [Candidatus Aenigmatarchaeota archaeon]
MVQVVKHMDFKGRESRIISSAITSVLKEFSKRTDVRKLGKIEIYVTKNPIGLTKKILSEIQVRRHGEIREWITQNTPSFTYWTPGKTPIILLNGNERIFKEMNYNAIEGLFSHELMHLLNKIDGIESKLEEQMDKSGKNILAILEKHMEKKPFTKERLFVSLIRVTNTSVLYIKDILANSRLMSFGFDEELYENYKSTFKEFLGVKFTENDIIDALKRDQKHFLDDIFLIYLGLSISWISFKMFENKWYRELKRMSNIDVPEVIRKNGNPIIKEMLKLRSGKDEKQILKIIEKTQDNYYKVVTYFCSKI